MRPRHATSRIILFDPSLTFSDFTDQPEQLLVIEGLLQEGLVGRAVDAASQENRFGVRVTGLDPAKRFLAPEAQHIQVQQKYVEWIGGFHIFGKGFFAGDRFDDVIALRFEDQSEGRAHQVLIVGKKDADGALCGAVYMCHAGESSPENSKRHEKIVV